MLFELTVDQASVQTLFRVLRETYPGRGGLGGTVMQIQKALANEFRFRSLALADMVARTPVTYIEENSEIESRT